MTPSGRLRKTKKETSNKFESPFNFSFAEREGLINPSRRCHGPPCKKKTDENHQINLSFHPFLFAEREGLTGPSLRYRGFPCKKKTDEKLSNKFELYIRFFLRRERDSNPRYLSVQRFSRPPHSTTLPSLQDFLSEVLFLKSDAKVRFYFKSANSSRVFLLFFFIYVLL